MESRFSVFFISLIQTSAANLAGLAVDLVVVVAAGLAGLVVAAVAGVGMENSMYPVVWMSVVFFNEFRCLRTECSVCTLRDKNWENDEKSGE